ncbi:Suppressor of white apricot, N-terminal domain [Dillenia turbinata]|uniref:Suppressor of white apricot, N-terminal domain n=1 Tax=Dillenia turbinata TaxID=194707 RepID=A0AAN8ZBQ6_9MAGN
MDLEVVGRHALFFDDDTNAAFVNSNDALVDWNSLLIDRYDVRHLLHAPPPPRRRRHASSPPLSGQPDESELDYERYLDLPPPSDEQGITFIYLFFVAYGLDFAEVLFWLIFCGSVRLCYMISEESDNNAEAANDGAYHAVAFSYGNDDDSTDQKSAEAGLVSSGFHPTFPVPESLLHNLPPTEKIHQIIARTAMFVGKHGGQSEIVLRVKQGDNPTFGFLMPDHHLHAYFRYLVDHQEFLKPDVGDKSQEEKKSAPENSSIGSGALSLLGSMYGEDDEGAAEEALESKKSGSDEPSCAANMAGSHESDRAETAHVTGRGEAASLPVLASKEKAPASGRVHSTNKLKPGPTSKLKKDNESLGSVNASVDKSRVSALPGTSKIETVVLEPPSELKRFVDKVVEFIVKNGKQFEAVLIEQDSKNGRFPFLIPSNQYHPYYLKVLQKAQEAIVSRCQILFILTFHMVQFKQKSDTDLKLSGKSFSSEEILGGNNRADKKSSLSRENEPSGHDIPFETDKKEKFKMVIGKSKKDAQDQPPRAAEQQFGVSVDAAAAAAILQAARRGIKNPALPIFQKASSNGTNQNLSTDGPQVLTFGSHLFSSSRPQNETEKLVSNAETSVSVPVANVIAKTAALAAASEADSSEASLTKEQKLKAERLKRAKMFAAMIKSGAAPLKSGAVRALSVDPPESGASDLSGLKDEVFNNSASNLSGSAAVILADKEREGSSVPADIDTSDKIDVSQKKSFGDDEKKESRKRRNWRSRRREEDDEEQEEEKEEHEGKEKERDHKHSRKKHRSHHSHRSSHESKDKHRHRKRHSSSKDMDTHHQHRHESSSEDEHRHRHRSSKHRKRSHREKEVELEEGEISTRVSDESRASAGDDGSREASLGLLDPKDGSSLSQPPQATEVPDELRAKIRAMLLATL